MYSCSQCHASFLRLSQVTYHARCYCDCQYYVALSRVVSQETINILTGSTMHQGIDGYFCDNVFYYRYRDSHLRTTKLSRGAMGIFASYVNDALLCRHKMSCLTCYKTTTATSFYNCSRCQLWGIFAIESRLRPH